MKKLTMAITEFLNFRAVCEKLRIKFDYTVKPGGQYIVEANAADLEIIGY